MGFVTHLVTASAWTYAIVFGVVAVDALLPFVQAEAVVITAAVLAAQGHLQIALIIPLAAAGGIVGDNGVYWLGRSVGDWVIRRFFSSGGRKRRLEQARKGIRRRGGLVILVARFLPVGRTLTNLAAGSLEMPWRRFVAWDAVAACAWAVYASMLGYVGGTSFEHSLWKPLVFALGIALLFGLALEVYRRVQKRRGRELLAGDF